MRGSYARTCPSVSAARSVECENWRCVATDEVVATRMGLPVIAFKRTSSGVVVDAARTLEVYVLFENAVRVEVDLQLS